MAKMIDSIERVLRGEHPAAPIATLLASDPPDARFGPGFVDLVHAT